MVEYGHNNIGVADTTSNPGKPGSETGVTTGKG